MPFPTIATPSNANRIVAGIQSVYARPSGGKYQTLGAIREGELAIELYSQMDSRRRNKSNKANTVTAKFTMMQASLIEIELMDSLLDGTNNFLFKLADAAAIPILAAVTTGWMLFTSSQIGVKTAKLVASGDVEQDQRIEIEMEGSLQDSELDAAVKASIDDNDFESSTDGGTFHAIGTYTAALDGGRPTMANRRSCGISALTLAFTGGAAQTLGPIDEPTIEFEWGSELDSLRVARPRWVHVKIEYKWKQTDSANLLNLDDFSDDEIDAVVTMKNGIVMTLTNQVGISTRFESVGDYDKTRSIIFKHSGAVLLADIDAIFA